MGVPIGGKEGGVMRKDRKESVYDSTDGCVCTVNYIGKKAKQPTTRQQSKNKADT